MLRLGDKTIQAKSASNNVEKLQMSFNYKLELRYLNIGQTN